MILAKKHVVLILLLTSLLGYTQKNLDLSFRPLFKELPVVLNSNEYVTDFGDTVTFSQFRFYISQITLVYKNGSSYQEPNSYHLLDSEIDSSLTITLNNVTSKGIKGLKFSIGIDSTASCSGAMDGDLDPIHGMYWAWNSGYINTKLEGTSNSCKTFHKMFQFHIGGYESPHQALRPIVLNKISKKKLKDSELIINMDLNTWFDQIDLSTENTIMIPGKEATQMADKYKTMFSIGSK